MRIKRSYAGAQIAIPRHDCCHNSNNKKHLETLAGKVSNHRSSNRMARLIETKRFMVKSGKTIDWHIRRAKATIYAPFFDELGSVTSTMKERMIGGEKSTCETMACQARAAPPGKMCGFIILGIRTTFPLEHLQGMYNNVCLKLSCTQRGSTQQHTTQIHLLLYRECSIRHIANSHVST